MDSFSNTMNRLKNETSPPSGGLPLPGPPAGEGLIGFKWPGRSPHSEKSQRRLCSRRQLIFDYSYKLTKLAGKILVNVLKKIKLSNLTNYFDRVFKK